MMASLFYVVGAEPLNVRDHLPATLTTALLLDGQPPTAKDALVQQGLSYDVRGVSRQHYEDQTPTFTLLLRPERSIPVNSFLSSKGLPGAPYELWGGTNALPDALPNRLPAIVELVSPLRTLHAVILAKMRFGESPPTLQLHTWISEPHESGSPLGNMDIVWRRSRIGTIFEPACFANAVASRCEDPVAKERSPVPSIDTLRDQSVESDEIAAERFSGVNACI
jgi:hypothetical protein